MRLGDVAEQLWTVHNCVKATKVFLALNSVNMEWKHNRSDAMSTTCDGSSGGSFTRHVNEKSHDFRAGREESDLIVWVLYFTHKRNRGV